MSRKKNKKISNKRKKELNSKYEKFRKEYKVALLKLQNIQEDLIDLYIVMNKDKFKTSIDQDYFLNSVDFDSEQIDLIMSRLYDDNGYTIE